MKNIVYNSKLQANGNIHIGDIYIIEGEKKTIPLELTSIPYIVKDDIIGRDDDIKRLHQTLKKESKLVLVNGMGGIGKTTFTKLYLNNKKDDYNYKIFLEFKENIFKTFVNNIQLLDSLHLTEFLKEYLKNNNYLSAFEIVINRIRQLGLNNSNKKNIIIIDNVSDSQIERLDLIDKIKINENWIVIVTSRIKFSTFKNFKLNVLTSNSAIKLFKKYYSIEDNIQYIKTILNLIGYNTLLIEIISKNSQVQRYKLLEIIENLKKKGIHFSSLDKSNNVSHNNNLSIEDINTYLLAIFNVSKISEKGIWILQFFSLLPSSFIFYESVKYISLKKLMKIEELNEKNIRIELYGLSKKGWLQYDEENDKFKIHELIQDVIFKKFYPDDITHVELIEKLNEELNYWKIDFSRNATFFAERILKKIKGKTPIFAELLDNYSAVLHRYDELDKAIIYQNRALELKLHLLEPDSETIGHSYTTLGLCYNELGEFSKAEQYLIEDLKITKRKSNYISYEMAISLNNLSLVYRNKNEIEKAFNYQLKAVEIAEEINDLDLNKVVYGNLGNIQYIKGNYREALANYNKEYDFLINNEGDELWISKNRSDTALLLIELGSLNEAIIMLDFAYETVVSLNPKSITLGYIYYNYGLFYLKKEIYLEAKNYFIKAEKRFRKILKNDNFWMQKIKNNLIEINKKL